jgi:hypothetical protein
MISVVLYWSAAWTAPLIRQWALRTPKTLLEICPLQKSSDGRTCFADSQIGRILPESWVTFFSIQLSNQTCHPGNSSRVGALLSLFLTDPSMCARSHSILQSIAFWPIRRFGEYSISVGIPTLKCRDGYSRSGGSMSGSIVITILHLNQTITILD